MKLRAWAWVAFVPLLTLGRCEEQAGGVALGVLARERVALTATASEIVVALPVAEGHPVAKGDVLVRLDDRLQAANVAIAEAERARAVADLEKLRAGARPEARAIAEARLASARAAFREAEAALARSRSLLESGTITRARFDQEVARHDALGAEMASAEEALAEVRAGARAEDLEIAEAQLAAAEARLAGEAARLADLTIRASRAGVLDSLPWNLGERVPQGRPVAILLAEGVPFARIYVPETHRVGLGPGAEVAVRVDGLAEPLAGRVRWISAEPAFTPYYALHRADRSRLVYLAEIALPDAAADLPVGIPVEVTLP